jgi:hypothetical protein
MFYDGYEKQKNEASYERFDEDVKS